MQVYERKTKTRIKILVITKKEEKTAHCRGKGIKDSAKMSPPLPTPHE